MTSHLALIVPLLLVSAAAALESEHIIGGHFASLYQFPYQVSIQRRGHFCGGTLIAADLVLTAAHCVYNNDRVTPVPYVVLAGTIDVTTRKGRKISVTKIYAHKQFSTLKDGTALNDIAILKLANKFDVSSTSAMGTVMLPDKNEDFEGTVAIVSGFGWDKVTVTQDEFGEDGEIGSTEGKLKYAITKIIDSYRCKARIYPSILCGRAIQLSSKSADGVCSGDSGGPLVYNNKIIGIVSSSPVGCDESESSAIYTKVSDFLDFIQGVMKDKPTADTLVVKVSS